MAVTKTVQHHHRPTIKSSNKPFKSRHATKSAIKEQTKGKVERLDKGVRRTPHQQVMSKLERRNHAKQLRQNKLDSRREEGSIFTGRDGAPRIVAIIPLCRSVSGPDVVAALNGSVEVEKSMPQQTSNWRVEISRFKQSVQYLTPPRSLIASMDACRVADFVIFVLSATEEVDSLGEQMLRCIESQGVSTVLTGVHDLQSIENPKKRTEILKSLKSYINHFFAAQEKVHDFGNRQECSNVMRSLCTTLPKGISWREDRTWMNIEEVDWESGLPRITGIVRGRNLKADRLVQVGSWGDLQIEKIVSAPWISKRKQTGTDEMTMDEADDVQVLDTPGDDQDEMIELAPEIAMDESYNTDMDLEDQRAVPLDDHHYFHKDEGDLKTPRRLPRGTSKYQSAWFLGEGSDSGSDMEDVDDDMEEPMLGPDHDQGPADGHFDTHHPEPTEHAPSEYPQSEAFFDHGPEQEAQEIESYRAQRRQTADEDLEFPDEIELHPNVSAKERLAKYRGLKSLRTSEWNSAADKVYQPQDWDRLLEIADYKAAKSRVLKEALVGGVKVGTRVQIHLKITPEQSATLRNSAPPTNLFSLLRHEHKHSAVNMSITLSSDYSNPLKSKETVFLQCGPRRLQIHPLFSEIGNTPNNVHKFDRFLHPGQTAVATFTGPILWGSVPCLYFKQKDDTVVDPVEDLAQAMETADTPDEKLELIGTGTSLPPSVDRVIAKRVILTGHPYKIHKKLVTVRYMFFSAEDVEYFRALQLWTKRGKSGFIKETLGTHGYFKATFDGKINPLDAVAISLYKRVWPRAALPWSV